MANYVYDILIMGIPTLYPPHIHSKSTYVRHKSLQI